MFNEKTIVSTALSSFNNAALYSPYFFIIGLLSLPIFFISYIYGRDILSKIGWNGNPETKVSFWSMACLMIWLLLVGGNYAVIRDSISLLPVLSAGVLFVSSIVLIKQSIQLKYFEKLKDKKTRNLIFGTLLIMAVFSGLPNLYNVLLNLSAIVCGTIIGCRLKKNFSGITISTFVFIFMTVLILMQPEYFRFGQLGNLTLLHLIALLSVGFCAMTVLAIRYTKPRAKLNQSVYNKMKLLFRLLSIFSIVLFVGTESVPVFLAVLGLTLLSEGLTIYHQSKFNADSYKQVWALMLACFGIVIMCPLITVLGVVYLSYMGKDLRIKKFIDLL